MNQPPRYPPYRPQPGGFGPPPPPPRRPGQLRRFASWYRLQTRPIQVTLGCILSLMVLFAAIFVCSASIAGVMEAEQGSATPTSVAQAAAAPTPTDAPTQQSTRPTPKPTLKPTPSPVPTPVPTQAPAPTPTANPCPDAPGGNPWCYDFNAGNYIYSPPADFCTYFSCISSFWSGQGYVMECQDQMYSKSGGRSGSCSRHGGDLRPLYSH